MSRLHEIAPESFYGWGDQMARARMVGGSSRREGACGALGGILKHYYSTAVGDPAAWLPIVEGYVGDDLGWSIGKWSEAEIAAVYVNALVAHLTKISDPELARPRRKSGVPT